MKESMEGEGMLEPWWRNQVEPGRRLIEVEPLETKAELKSQGDAEGLEEHSGAAYRRD